MRDLTRLWRERVTKDKVRAYLLDLGKTLGILAVVYWLAADSVCIGDVSGECAPDPLKDAIGLAGLIVGVLTVIVVTARSRLSRRLDPAE